MGRPITASMIEVGPMPEAGLTVLSIGEPHKNIQQTRCEVVNLCCGKRATISIQAILRRVSTGMANCSSCGKKAKGGKKKPPAVYKTQPIMPPPDDVPGWGQYLTNWGRR